MNVQIPKDIFTKICKSYLFGDTAYDDEITRYLEDKLENIVKHDYYTKYKSAPSEAEREQARQQYLDLAGINQDFRKG